MGTAKRNHRQRPADGSYEFRASLGLRSRPDAETRSFVLRKTDAVHPLSDCLETVDSPDGRQSIADYLKSHSFPHYEAVSGHRGLLVRTDSDRTRTPRRFVNRRFEPSHESRDS